MLSQVMVEVFRGYTSRYDSPRNNLRVLEEDPKSTPQDPKETINLAKKG